MKLLLSFFILILPLSCTDQTTENKIDEYIVNCMDETMKLNSSFNESSSFQSIHQNFENFLLEHHFLKGKKKSDYLELFRKIENREIYQSDVATFYNNLKIDPDSYILNTLMLDKYCFNKAFEEKIYDSNNWRHKYMTAIFEISNEGSRGLLNDFTSILDPIPESKFREIIYRYYSITIAFKLIGENK